MKNPNDEEGVFPPTASRADFITRTQGAGTRQQEKWKRRVLSPVKNPNDEEGVFHPPQVGQILSQGLKELELDSKKSGRRRVHGSH